MTNLRRGRTMKKQFLRFIEAKNGKVTLEELIHSFSDRSEEEIQQTLDELVEKNIFYKLNNDTYLSTCHDGLLLGKIRSHPKGFAFFKSFNGVEEEIFIPKEHLKHAIHLDIAYVKLKKGKQGDRKEGKVISIVQRGNSKIVGTLFQQGSEYFVIPDDPKINLEILIADEFRQNAVKGHKVVCQLLHYLEEEKKAEGEIVEIIGHENDPGVDILSIVHRYGISVEFPDEVLQEVDEVSGKIPEKEYKKRRDLRDELIVTIDGEDAKDLDDAVQVKKLDNGNYKLGVHIADVSYYVTQGSELDKEAFQRGTSVYLVDRVIPMLPHKLSNGICSLNPKEDRLAMSCEMEINEQGHVVSYDIFESVIQSKERMTYTNVNRILHQEELEKVKGYTRLFSTFELMEELAGVLRERRNQDGSVHFESKEAKIQVDKDGKPTEITFRERFEAEKLIEEFMLIANETVAKHFTDANIPFIYRIHDYPKEKRMETFATFASTLGYRIKGNFHKMPSKEVQKLLKQVEGKAEENVINRLILRTMQQAKYAPQNIGHYGLAKENYTHFTSPIRRYPDLMVHRLIREILFNEKDIQNDENHFQMLLEVTENSSYKERTAVEVERAVDQMKKTEYMSAFVGNTFEGIISSVAKFGFFVELDSSIEGLVPLEMLPDDKYKFEEGQMALIGKKTKKKYQIGDKVAIKVMEANKKENTITFALLKGSSSAKKKEKVVKDLFRKKYKQY